MKELAEQIAVLAGQSAAALGKGDIAEAMSKMSQMIVLQKQMNSELKAKETEE